MPLTKNRDTKERINRDFNAPVAAAKIIYQGALVALDTSGNLTPGATATTLKGAGRAKKKVDNASGSAGDVTAPYEKGTFLFANSAGADEITRAEIGDNCYIVDDETVAKTDGSSSRSVAGVVADIETSGVWVTFA